MNLVHILRGIGDLQRKLLSQVIIERKIMSAFLLIVWKHKLNSMIPGLQKTVNISTISITGNYNTKQVYQTSSFM